jgi:hypothetical protein
MATSIAPSVHFSGALHPDRNSIIKPGEANPKPNSKNGSDEKKSPPMEWLDEDAAWPLVEMIADSIALGI